MTKTSYCLNPACPQPFHPNIPKFCAACGDVLLLKDRYLAQRLIGQGGFGRTWLAIDQDQPSQPQCVIKQFLFINHDERIQHKAIELFEQEAQQLEKLGKHPQIPELLAYFHQAVQGTDQPYLVQEFIDGENLEQELQRQGHFNQIQIQELLVSLLPVLIFWGQFLIE